MSKNILMDAPSVGASEKKFLSIAVDSGYVSTAGPFVPEFEKKFAGYLGVKSAVSTQSGTAAIHVALHELGIGKGDEVIVPALTFVATVNPVLYVGAKPVLADVDLDTWNISPASIEKLITKRTKAVIPVHLYGNPCDMGAILSIARDRGLYVIEDATESLGARYRGKFTGTFGDLGCFSFNGNKTITTGGGGMVVGSHRQRVEHIKFLVNQARDEAKGYYHPEVGFNYRMTNLEAALGLAQLRKLDRFVGLKRKIARIYRDEMGDAKGAVFQKELKGSDSSFWLTALRFEQGIKAEDVRERLKKHGVPSRGVFMPVSDLPPYKRCMKDDLKNTRLIYRNGLCLASSVLNAPENTRYAAKLLRRMVCK